MLLYTLLFSILGFSRASAVLSAIVDLKSMLSRAFSADCESVSIFTYLGNRPCIYKFGIWLLTQLGTLLRDLAF